MLTSVPPTDCMRAREALSARLDGELGELDALRLDQHLEGCSECAGFAIEAAGLARALRAAALDPAPADLFVTHRHRRVGGPIAVAAATLVVALATGSSFFMGELVGGHAVTGQSATTATGQLDTGLVAMLHGNSRPQVRTGRVVAL
jgi:predicted anti-sigma-YlaC factor YlaD